MPVTYLDIGLAVIMLISALLAMVRGFVREVLSIASWALAAIATWYGYPRLLPIAQTQVSNELIAKAIVIAGIFLTVLVIVSLITIKISDAILDSKIGVLDRTLGFAFGLARGLLIVLVAFSFFFWLVEEKNWPSWVADAKSTPTILKPLRQFALKQLPADFDLDLRNLVTRGARPTPDAGGAPQTPAAPAAPGQAPAAPQTPPRSN